MTTPKFSMEVRGARCVISVSDIKDELLLNLKNDLRQSPITMYYGNLQLTKDTRETQLFIAFLMNYRFTIARNSKNIVADNVRLFDLPQVLIQNNIDVSTVSFHVNYNGKFDYLVNMVFDSLSELTNIINSLPREFPNNATTKLVLMNSNREELGSVFVNSIPELDGQIMIWNNNMITEKGIVQFIDVKGATKESPLSKVCDNIVKENKYYYRHKYSPHNYGKMQFGTLQDIQNELKTPSSDFEIRDIMWQLMCNEKSKCKEWVTNALELPVVDFTNDIETEMTTFTKTVDLYEELSKIQELAKTPGNEEEILEICSVLKYVFKK